MQGAPGESGGGEVSFNNGSKRNMHWYFFLPTVSSGGFGCFQYRLIVRVVSNIVSSKFVFFEKTVSCAPYNSMGGPLRLNRATRERNLSPRIVPLSNEPGAAGAPPLPPL